VSDRLARASEARRQIARDVQRVHLGDRVVDAQQGDAAQVQGVRLVERQARAGDAPRAEEAVGG
jgi:hypothetical protein